LKPYLEMLGRSATQIKIGNQNPKSVWASMLHINIHMQ
jgi:hypothetical protein